MNMYMPNMELHIILHCLPLLLALLAVEAFELNSSAADSSRTPRSSRRVVRLYSGTRPEPIVCHGEGFQADPANCAVFYRCMKSGRGRFMTFKFQCAPGTVFDPDTEVCNHPSSVKRSNCGIEHTISVSEQIHDNAIEDVRQELPSPITTKVPFYTEIFSSSTSHLLLTSHRQDLSTSPSITPSIHDRNKLNSNPTVVQVHNVSNHLFTESSTRKQRPTTPKISVVSRKPSEQNGDLCRSEGFIGDSENCRKFYRCISNLRGGYIRYEFMCTESTIWDDDIQSCNHAWAVKRRRCGRGNVNEVSHTHANKNQEVQHDNTNSKVTPNVNLVQHISGSQTSTSYVTQSPLTTIIQTTRSINSTTSNYVIDVRQTRDYVSSTERTRTTSKGEENDVGYNDMNMGHDEEPITNECTESGFMGDKNDCKRFYRCVDNGRGSYTKYEFSCGEGTVWDPTIDACNHAWAVKNCGGKDPTSDSGITTTSGTMTSTKSTPTYVSTSKTTMDDNEDIGYGNQNQNPTTTSITTSTTTLLPLSSSTSEVTKQPGSKCASSGFMGDVNDCKKFYRCVDTGDGTYTRYEFSCGKGTVWDPEIEACNHPWAVKRCSGSSSITTEKLESSPIVTDATIHTTQSTAHTQNDDFDSGYGIQTEDNSANLDASSTSTTSTTSKQPSNSNNNCMSNGFIGDQSDCKKFYRCVDNGYGGFTRYEFMCGEGTVWDPKIDACNHAWAVEKCGGTHENEQNKEEATTSHGITTLSSSTVTTSYENEIDTGYGQPSSQSTTVSTSKNPLEEPNTPSSDECKSSGFMGDKNNCKKFYRCVENENGGFTRYEFICGDGTIWNQEIQTCDHDRGNSCTANEDTPVNKEPENDEMYTDNNTTQGTATSESLTSEIHTSTQSTAICQSEGFYGNPNDCRKFHRCVENGQGSFTKFDFTCGDGTVWDQEIQACNHESSSKCSANNTFNTNETTTTQFSSTTTSTESSENQSSQIDSTNNDICISEGFFANSMDCKRFYRCVDNSKGGYTKYEFSCGEGTMWVQDIQACDHQDYDSNCASNSGSTNPQQDHQSTTAHQSSSSSVTSSSIDNTTERPHDEYQDTSSNSSQDNNICSSEGFYPDSKDCKKFYRCVDDGKGSYTKYDFSCGDGTAWDTDIQTCNHINEVRRCQTGNQDDSSNIPTQEDEVSQTSESNELTQKPATESSENIQTSSKDSCETEGYFGNSQDCTKFYRCVDNGKGGYTKYDFDCGEGTIWDQDIATCNHPQDVTNPSCKQTSESSSSSTSTTQSSNTDNTSEQTSNCSHENTTKKPANQNVTCEKAGYYANPNDCKKFYRCVDWDGNGERFSVYHFECGEGTIWDPQLDTCNHEESVYPPRDCSGIQSQNENNAQEISTEQSSSSQQTTESTTQDSTTTEQTTTTEKSTTEETTTQESATSESTSTQQTTSTQGTTTTTTEGTTTTTTEGTTTSTTEETTTTTTEGTTTTTTEETTTTTEGTTTTTEGTTTTTEGTTTTTEGTTTTTEGTTTTTEGTTTTTKGTTTEQSVETESTTTTTEGTTSQQTTESTTTNDQQSTTDESTTTQKSTTSQTSTTDTSETEQSTDSQSSTTESMSTTEQTDDGSTTDSSSTEQTSEKECPDTEEDQYLYVCPTSFRRHPKYCNKFYQCTEDDDNQDPKIAVFTCPNNTIYDESKTQCVEENKAEKKCKGQIAQQRRVKRLNTYYKEPIVVGKEKYSCSSTGYYPFEKSSDCSPAFLKCQKEKFGKLRGYVHLCPEGFLYWNISKRCERKASLKDCKTSVNDWSRRWEIPVERKNVAL